MKNINDWMRERSLSVADELVELNRAQILKKNIAGFGMKDRVLQMIIDLKAVLFPSLYKKGQDSEYLNIQVMNHLNKAALMLQPIIRDVLIGKCELQESQNCDRKTCEEKASDISTQFMQSLPEIRAILSTDIKAAYEGDPAAMHMEEILLSYPSIEAVSIYRMAHSLSVLGVPLIPRIMTEYAHANTGIDIHPGATIGNHFFIDHGTGVVIGETAMIGNNVKLYQGVTLGARSFELDAQGNPVKGIKRHPNIEDNVIIYSGATILGGDVTVGHDSTIGGNVWLVTSVPPYSVVYNASPEPFIKNRKDK